MSYSLAALQRWREQQAAEAREPKRLLLLDRVPPDAPMDEGLVLGVWNGERFVSWHEWQVSKPVEVSTAPTEHEVSPDATCVTAVCGTTRVWLVRDGERWLMCAGSRRPSTRRRDFATPFLAHAQRTAEEWYGPAQEDWHEER